MTKLLLDQFPGTPARSNYANLSLLTQATTSRQKDKASARQFFTLAGISFSLFAALIYVAAIIGASTASAGVVPEFDIANVVAIKQSASVGGFAIGSISMIAVGAIVLLSTPLKILKK